MVVKLQQPESLMLPPSRNVFLIKSYEHSECCFLNTLHYFLALLSIPFRMYIRIFPADGKRFPGNSLGIEVVQTMLTSLYLVLQGVENCPLKFRLKGKNKSLG